ncbi:hypothetical protein ACLB2K_029271 [Fragaria x ananassa]
MTAKPGLRSLAAVSYTNLSLSLLSPQTSLSLSLSYPFPSKTHLHSKRPPFVRQNSPQRPFEYTRLLFHYTRNDRNHDAISLFVAAYRAGLPVNGPVLSSVAKACRSLRDQVAGRQVHCQCVKSGLGEDVSVGTSFVDMYMKSSEGVVEGRRVFDEMRERNVVSWTSLISGYAWNGWNEQALELFMDMQASGSMANPFTYAAVLGVLADEGSVGKGEQVHGMVVKNGYVAITFVCNSLVNMYFKSGMVSEARAVFDGMECRDAVTWNTVIAGYVGNGLELEAFEMFYLMGLAGVKFTRPVFVTVIKLCASYEELDFARQLHCRVLKSGLESHRNIETALLVAYSKCREMDDAFNMFSMMQGVKSVVTWTAMISGYLQNGGTEKGVKLFCEMSREGVRPNDFTNFTHTIPEAEKVFQTIDEKDIVAWLNNTLCLSSALVTMHAKMGNIESANEVFKRQGERDLVSWNSMISGYAQHGQGNKVLEVFEELCRRNLEIDGITFILIISACTHAGLVDEGKRYFNMMVQDYHIDPTMGHYSCMVDLYSRAGKLEKAMNLINSMPCIADANVWRALLGACRVHRNLELGKLAAEKLISLQPQDSAAYVLLSNIYAAAGNWQERDKVRRLMNERKVKKQPGYSWIEVKNKTYTFLAGDVSHPLSNHIYSKLDELNNRLKDMG